MTNWPSGLQPGEQYGVVRTSDYGITFERFLLGEKINDLDFKGSYIFAAGDDGLFISPDNGQSWERFNGIQSDNTFIKNEAAYLSVASASERVWIGTSDGIASTADFGQSWQITRVDFPLQGGNRYQQDAPSVEAYAYPSPFSPGKHSIIRIKFEVKQQGRVKVRLFDFGMNLVKEIENGTFNTGTYEAAWDGTDSRGRQVANGPILYQIETPGNLIRGKFLVIE
jgi:ligand-binding sensor domain-containing protein